MRNYELVCIFDVENDGFNMGVVSVKEVLSKYGVEITKEEDMGDRPLAYDIKKKTRGHYSLLLCTINPESIIKIEDDFRLIKSLLKHLFVKKD